MIKISLTSRKFASFSSLKKLIEIVNNEPYFAIQVFTLETVELFESTFEEHQICYSKTFASTFKPRKELQVILGDTDLVNFPAKSRIILYSNKRDSRFIPYKFVLTAEEKALYIEDKQQYEINKNKSLSSTNLPDINMHEYTAKSLNTLQSVIVFSLIRARKFMDLCREVAGFDNSYSNSFIIRCELNLLIKLGICKRIGKTYRLSISSETVRAICSGMGLENR